MTEFSLKEAPSKKVSYTNAAETGRLDQWKAELAEYFQKMKQFVDVDPSEVFLCLSQFSARAGEMRMNIVSNETRREAAFRTRIIDPFIDECDRQFKIHSRLVAIREAEWKMAGGSFT